MPFCTCFSSSLADPRVPVGRPWWAADGSRGSGREEAKPQELQWLHRALAAGMGVPGGRGLMSVPSPPPSVVVSVNKEVVRGCRCGLHPEALIPENTGSAQLEELPTCSPSCERSQQPPRTPPVTVPVPPSIISATVLGRFGDRPQWSELLFLLHFGAILVTATFCSAFTVPEPHWLLSGHSWPCGTP